MSLIDPLKQGHTASLRGLPGRERRHHQLHGPPALGPLQRLRSSGRCDCRNCAGRGRAERGKRRLAQAAAGSLSREEDPADRRRYSAGCGRTGAFFSLGGSGNKTRYRYRNPSPVTACRLPWQVMWMCCLGNARI